MILYTHTHSLSLSLSLVKRENDVDSERNEKQHKHTTNHTQDGEKWNHKQCIYAAQPTIHFGQSKLVVMRTKTITSDYELVRRFTAKKSYMERRNKYQFALQNDTRSTVGTKVLHQRIYSGT